MARKNVIDGTVAQDMQDAEDNFEELYGKLPTGDIVGISDTQTLTNKTLTAPNIDTINLTGGQIAFPATANLSSDGNTLDDYEEGTFTPTVYDAATGGNQASTSVATGNYVKIGRRVFIDIIINNIDTTGMTAGNDVHIRGLPFSCNITGRPLAGGLIVERVTSTALMITPEMQSDSIVLAETISASVRDNLIVSDLSSGLADLRIAGFYATNE